LSERFQIRLATYEQRIAGERHVRTDGQGAGVGNHIQRHCRAARLGPGQPLVGDHSWRRLLECCDDRCGLLFEQQTDLMLQVILERSLISLRSAN
jgi:hypothetical protein